VIALPRTYGNTNQIAGLDSHTVQRAHLKLSSILRDPTGQPQTRTAVSKFEDPINPIAAFDVCVLDLAFNTQAGGRWALPANDHSLFRTWMHSHPMRFQLAWNADVFAGGIRKHAQRIRSHPAFHELVGFGSFELLG
jgi:hypothetical protein